MDIIVISLERTPERLKRFRERNIKSLSEFQVINGIDGLKNWDILKKSRLISKSAREHWTKGAIGSALSHSMAWRICIEKNKAIIVFEDDILISRGWEKTLNKLIVENNLEFDFILLGWNFDSVLRAELFPGINITSLFDPPYPNEEELLEVLNNQHKTKLHKLKNAFGLPGYIITPKCAKKLINFLLPLKAEKIHISRGIPELTSYTLDAQLNKFYKKINAYVSIDPIAIALNNPEESLTNRRNNPRKFLSN